MRLTGGTETEVGYSDRCAPTLPHLLKVDARDIYMKPEVQIPGQGFGELETLKGW